MMFSKVLSHTRVVVPLVCEFAFFSYFRQPGRVSNIIVAAATVAAKVSFISVVYSFSSSSSWGWVKNLYILQPRLKP